MRAITTTTDSVQTAIGTQLIAQTSLTSDNIKYQMDPVDSPYQEDMVYINEGNIEKKKLLRDLYYNSCVSHIVCWVNQDTGLTNNVPVELRTDLNDLLETKITSALLYDPSLGSVVYDSEVVSIITDGGVYAAAGKAVGKIFFRSEYYTNPTVNATERAVPFLSIRYDENEESSESDRESALRIVISSIEDIDSELKAMRGNRSFKLTDYEVDDLPLFVLRTPAPNLMLQPGERIVDSSDLYGELYYIDWDESPSLVEEWIKKIVEGVNISPSARVSLDWHDTAFEYIATEYPIVGIQFRWKMKIYSSKADF